MATEDRAKAFENSLFALTRPRKRRTLLFLGGFIKIAWASIFLTLMKVLLQAAAPQEKKKVN